VIRETTEYAVATISLNDPSKRNALSTAMFHALDDAIARIARDDAVRAVLVRGEGAAFCAGFDLGAVVEQPARMAVFIERLSGTLRAIRRLPQPVVGAVHGAAIAGGCAILSACDFVFVEPGAKLGYPVHRIGVSPAVTLPLLMPFIGAGASRALVLSGELIDGREARRIGLASDLIEGAEAMHAAALAHARSLASKPSHALRVTKKWINELDGSLENDRIDAPARGSMRLADGDEAVTMLRAAWRR